MATRDDLLIQQQAALDILDQKIADAERQQAGAVGPEVDRWADVIAPMLIKRDQLAAQIIRAEMSAPEMQAAVAALQSQTAVLSDTASKMRSLTDYLNLLSGFLGSVNGVVQTLQ